MRPTCSRTLHLAIPFPIRTLQIDRRSRKQVDGKATAAKALQLQTLFQALSEDQIATLVAGATHGRFGRRERIIEQGSDGGTMFVLVDGTAEVYVASDGLEMALVATLRAGECFGEMSLLSGEKRIATVVAVTDCDVLEINKTSFGRLVHDHPEILEGLSELLAARKMETQEVLESASKREDPIAREEAIRAGILAKFYSYFGL